MDDREDLETRYDGHEAETEQLQNEPQDSPALDQDVDGGNVQVLPGTGGPDDTGAVDEEDGLPGYPVP